MCGIVGVINHSPVKDLTGSQFSIFEELLFANELRGKDSTGIMLGTAAGRVRTLKNSQPASAFLKSEHYIKWYNSYITKDKIHCIFGHNRLATVGKVVAKNSHPFTEGDITLMHNGSHKSVFEEFKEDIPDNLKMDVDSHAVAYLINKYGLEEYLKKSKTLPEAAFVFFDSKDKSINIYRNYARPLHFFKDFRGVYYIASEELMLKWILNRGKISGKLDIEPFKPYHLYKMGIDADEFTVTEIKHSYTWGDDNSNDSFGFGYVSKGPKQTNVTTVHQYRKPISPNEIIGCKIAKDINETILIMDGSSYMKCDAYDHTVYVPWNEFNTISNNFKCYIEPATIAGKEGVAEAKNKNAYIIMECNGIPYEYTPYGFVRLIRSTEKLAELSEHYFKKGLLETKPVIETYEKEVQPKQEGTKSNNKYQILETLYFKPPVHKTYNRGDFIEFFVESLNVVDKEEPIIRIVGTNPELDSNNYSHNIIVTLNLSKMFGQEMSEHHFQEIFPTDSFLRARILSIVESITDKDHSNKDYKMYIDPASMEYLDVTDIKPRSDGFYSVNDLFTR
jgi:hypothetical protein